jgi:hypothetical protein
MLRPSTPTYHCHLPLQEGLIVEEVVRVSPTQAIPPDLADQIKGVNSSWCSRKGGAASTAWFLARPPLYEAEAQGGWVGP